MSKAGATRPYPLRIPEEHLGLAEARSRDEKTDRPTALRQLLYAGAKVDIYETISFTEVRSKNQAGSPSHRSCCSILASSTGSP